MKKSHLEFAAGLMVGAVLFGGGAAYAAGIMAQRSYQPVYVDGQQVPLEAYAIEGHNYVKLRDIGQAVGFEVYWDNANGAVRIVSDQPYTGEPPAQATQAQTVDHSQAANPAVFAGELSRENYNAIRDTIVNRDAIVAGTKQPVPLGAFTLYGDVDEAAIAVGGYPAYEIVSRPGGGYVCTAKYPETYKPAAEHTQGFIDGLAGKSERDKITAITWYVADRITYSVAYPGPGKVLAQDGQIPGACMAYAYSFQFLCNRANIPCILKRGGNHQWNMVYVDGQWWDVDVTACDAGDDTSVREYVTILHDPAEHEMAGFIDEEPKVTAFAKELLVPGSTK